MIEAKDLRVGNWVHNPVQKLDFSVGVDAIVIVNNDNLNKRPTFEPIPLTEEWLLKIGEMPWTAEGWSYGMYYSLEDKHLYYDICFALCERISWTKIEYVHQLQNLYHALTGEELIINE